MVSADTSAEEKLRELEQQIEQQEAKQKAEVEKKKQAEQEKIKRQEEERKEEERKEKESKSLVQQPPEEKKQQEEGAVARQPAEETEQLKDKPVLDIGHSCTFTLQYKDKGSGGHLDVSIYDPRLESGYRSIGSYAQGNYDNPNGCITVVKALAERLPDGKPPLAYPAGYNLIWTDKKSGADMDGSVWQPRAPDNDYVCIGSVGQTGYSEPNIAGYACVHKCLVKAGSISSVPVWTDEGTGATSQITIFQLSTSRVMFALPSRAAPGVVYDLNPAGICQ